MILAALRFSFAPEWVNTWLTPVWLIGVGALLGLVALIVFWLLAKVLCRVPGLNVVIPPAAVDEIPLTLREGALRPLLLVVYLFAAFGIFGTLLTRNPDEILASLTRLRATGTTKVTETVPAAENPDEPGQVAVPLSFRKSELRRLLVHSSARVELCTEKTNLLTNVVRWDVSPNQDSVVWQKTGGAENPFKTERVTELYVSNYDNKPAELTFTLVTAPEYPEVITAIVAAVGVALMILLYFLQKTHMPRLSAVALATLQSEISQPLFLLLIAGGSVLLVAFVFLPYFTLGEDIKMLKEAGVRLITILAIIEALWAASTSVSEEIEGRTALTVLSKPIRRHTFLIGKFVGIVWTVVLMFSILGSVFVFTVTYKPLFDAKEMGYTPSVEVPEFAGREEPNWQICHLEMASTMPSLALGMMEAAVLASLSVAISTRLPLAANFLICTSIYVLGHLTPLIVQSSMEQFEIVAFFGRLITTLVPNLESFDTQAAVADGVYVPFHYLGWALLYCGVYSLIALLLGLVLFEDRDLA